MEEKERKVVVVVVMVAMKAKNFHIQLESVAKISNLQYIAVLQSYGNPIY